MPSVKVLNQSDARPYHFQELLKSNGSWRIVIFTGDIQDSRQKDRLKQLGQRLGSPDSFVKRFTPGSARHDAVFEVLAVHSGPRTSATIFDFPEVFRHFDEIDGYDYAKILVDDESYHEGHGHLFDSFGINPQEGCAVILRPDQYVSYVGKMDAYEELDRFFSGFMIVQERQVNGKQSHSPISSNSSPTTIVEPDKVEGAAMVI